MEHSWEGVCFFFFVSISVPQQRPLFAVIRGSSLALLPGSSRLASALNNQLRQICLLWAASVPHVIGPRNRSNRHIVPINTEGFHKEPLPQLVARCFLLMRREGVCPDRRIPGALRSTHKLCQPATDQDAGAAAPVPCM